MTVSKRLRYEVFRRDNHACRYCGGAAPDATLTVDHVVPTALGGSDDPSNLVTACRDCNAGKSASSPDAPLVADVEQDALRWARAMEEAIKIQTRHQEIEKIAIKILFGFFDDRWHAYETDFVVPRPDDWTESVLTFWRHGLSGPDIDDAMVAAMENRRIAHERVWRYFCGICWRILNERREIAAALIAADDAERSSQEASPHA